MGKLIFVPIYSTYVSRNSLINIEETSCSKVENKLVVNYDQNNSSLVNQKLFVTYKVSLQILWVQFSMVFFHLIFLDVRQKEKLDKKASDEWSLFRDLDAVSPN